MTCEISKKTAMQKKPTKKQIKPGPNEKCLCGSDLKFKKCCAARLPETKSLGDAYLQFCEDKDFDAALLAARADLTKYTILHRSHTATGLFGRTPISVDHMWLIDVEALFHYADRLRRIYSALGICDGFPAVLERLRNNIKSDHWQQKVILLHTLSALGTEWDVDAGYSEIKKLGSIDAVRDPVILAVYLNLTGDRLSLAERLKLIDRVRETSQEDSDIIHQGVVKATLLLLHNDPRGAGHALEEVIEYCKTLDDLDPFQRQKYGQAHFIMGAILLDTEKARERASQFLDQAAVEFTKYMTIDSLTDVGRAEGHRDLADTFRLQENWQPAIEQYEAAIEISGNPILHVFRAVCLSSLDKMDEALAAIDALSMDSFDDDTEKADYVLHFATLAVATGGRNRLQQAKQLLDIPLKRDPVFQQQALSMTKVVLEAIASGKSSSLMRKARGILTGLNSSLILQPNFMGLGVNLNKLIDEGVAKPDTAQSEEKSK